MTSLLMWPDVSIPAWDEDTEIPDGRGRECVVTLAHLASQSASQSDCMSVRPSPCASGFRLVWLFPAFAAGFGVTGTVQAYSLHTSRRDSAYPHFPRHLASKTQLPLPVARRR